METILIEPKNKHELAFITEMLKRMDIKNRILSIDETKEIILNEYNKHLNIETVVNDLKKENYNKDFINDIVTGLKKSSVYANKD